MGDKDRGMRMSSLTNEKPLEVMKVGVNVVWEVIEKDCCNGSNCMIWKRKASLRRSGDGSVS